MNWWDILKNTKLSGKAKGKGTSFDASKIKINIDKDDCKKELKQILGNAFSYANSGKVEEEFIENELPEEVACKFIEKLKNRLPPNYSSVENTWYGYFSVNVHQQDLEPHNNYLIAIINGPDRIMYVRLKGLKGVSFSRFIFTEKDYSRWVKSI